MSQELHGAFVWDCDECGQENFVRAIEGQIDEPAMQEGDPVGFLVAGDEVKTDEEEVSGSAWMQQRIILLPAMVTCSSCKNIFPTHVWEPE